MILPPELVQYILQIKSKTAWEHRKKKIHQKLESIIPRYEHESHFVFNNYDVYYVRTLHQDFTITIRRNNYFEVNQVIYLFVDTPENPYCHTTKFWHLPVTRFQGVRRGIELPAPHQARSLLVEE